MPIPLVKNEDNYSLPNISLFLSLTGLSLYSALNTFPYSLGKGEGKGDEEGVVVVIKWDEYLNKLYKALFSFNVTESLSQKRPKCLTKSILMLSDDCESLRTDRWLLSG